MPRPGPRPYECVRRAWHSDSHQPLRGGVTQEIFRIVTEFHSSETRSKKEWQEKLPIVVLRAEEILYSKARTEAEYTDVSTLKARLDDAVNTMIRRTDDTSSNSKDGPYMEPCVEAALSLGCTPKMNPRGQRPCSSRLSGPSSSNTSGLKRSSAVVGGSSPAPSIISKEGPTSAAPPAAGAAPPSYMASIDKSWPPNTKVLFASAENGTKYPAAFNSLRGFEFDNWQGAYHDRRQQQQQQQQFPSFGGSAPSPPSPPSATTVAPLAMVFPTVMEPAGFPIQQQQQQQQQQMSSNSSCCSREEVMVPSSLCFELQDQMRAGSNSLAPCENVVVSARPLYCSYPSASVFHHQAGNNILRTAVFPKLSRLHNAAAAAASSTNTLSEPAGGISRSLEQVEDGLELCLAPPKPSADTCGSLQAHLQQQRHQPQQQQQQQQQQVWSVDSLTAFKRKPIQEQPRADLSSFGSFANPKRLRGFPY